jgi:hypothetical protein
MMVRAMMIEGDATEKVAQDAFEPYGITKYCVYTIVDGERLVRLAKEIGKHSFIQSKPWVTARNLWQKTSLAKESMPILFGDATNCSRLLFWGLLTNVCVEGRETTFVVDRLRELSEEHEPQELVLRSSGKYIAPNFIRPYAICLTPHFLNFAQTG